MDSERAHRNTCEFCAVVTRLRERPARVRSATYTLCAHLAGLTSRVLVVALAAAAWPLTALTAAAQEVPRVGVMERPRPDYDAKGIPLGSFRLYPTLDVAASFEDNVFQSETNVESDTHFEASPAVRLTSDWSSHRLELAGNLTAYRYATFDSENIEDWSLSGNGRIDIRRSTDLSFIFSQSKLHEDRSSPNSPGNVESPVRYGLMHAESTLAFRPNRFGAFLSAAIDQYSFDDTPLIGGGTLNNRDRDRDHLRLSARFSYEFSPEYVGFVRSTYDVRDFDLDLDDFGVDRDSTGITVDAGLDLKLANLLRGEIFAGYLEQDFKAPLPDISQPSFGAALYWYATPLITVRAGARQNLNDTTLGGASVSNDQSFNLGVDYEVLRNLVFRATTTFTDSEFDGTSRTDSTERADVELIYFLNRNLSATARYVREKRDSTAPSEDFSENTLNVGFRVQL